MKEEPGVFMRILEGELEKQGLSIPIFSMEEAVRVLSQK